MSGKDENYDDGRGYQGDDYDGANTYMQGDGECETNNSQKLCDICEERPGSSLESFEDGVDYERIDDCGRTEEVDDDFVICDECLKKSHDAHWYATHPEFLGFSEPED